MATSVKVLVPDIGGFKDVSVVDVLVMEGQQIDKETPLITIETEKAAMDVPAPAAGRVREIKLKQGDKVSEGSLILLLEAAGTEPASAAPATAAPSASSAAAAPAASAPKAAAPVAAAAPRARRIPRKGCAGGARFGGARFRGARGAGPHGCTGTGERECRSGYPQCRPAGR